MQPSDSKLSTNQERAIVALLTEPTVAAAAVKAGVNESTIWRWQQQERFQSAYRAARRTAMENGVATLQRLVGAAVGCLEAVMADKNAPSGSRVSAAKIVLDAAMQGVELYELSDRLESLEQRLQDAEDERDNRLSGGNGRWQAAA